ncbi:MAG: undecaprenyl-diphosphatase UppP [Anaerolineae bacterium]|jgi:undecaprenyl-diphosphatase
MSLFQALLLGVLQGATEFLPVSSSGHLVLVPWLLRWQDPGLTFDVMVHWATALAVVGYFWRDWLDLGRASWEAVRTRSLASDQARLALLIILGSVPAAAAGVLLEDFFERAFSRPPIAATLLLVTAGLLTTSERLSRQDRGLEDLRWADGLLIGIAQALAILPGISRSGATIATGILTGLRREAAARFSFLLATPIIVGAGLFKLLELIELGGLATQAPTLLVGTMAALLTGLACIHFLLRYLRRRSLYPFAAYCAAAGIACLVVALIRG